MGKGAQKKMTKLKTLNDLVAYETDIYSKEDTERLSTGGCWDCPKHNSHDGIGCGCTRAVSFDMKPIQKGVAYHTDIKISKLRANAITWIKELRKAKENHWIKLNAGGYVNFKSTDETEDPYGFELEGMRFEEWHEASDVNGAIKIIKKFFNIEEEDLK